MLGTDLLALMDALALPRAVLAGYDWGGRAACVVAALWPERVRGLVSCDGYNIQDIAARRSRRRRARSIGCGISTTSIATAAGPAWRRPPGAVPAAVAALVADLAFDEATLRQRAPRRSTTRISSPS